MTSKNAAPTDPHGGQRVTVEPGESTPPRPLAPVATFSWVTDCPTDAPTIDFETGIYVYQAAPWSFRSWRVDMVVADTDVVNLKWDEADRNTAARYAAPIALALRLPLFIARRDGRRKLPFVWEVTP